MSNERNVKGLLGTKLGMTQVWDENNRVVQQTVKVGVLNNDGMREIVSGVTPDDRYVVEALMNVRPGMTVKPVREKTKR